MDLDEIQENIIRYKFVVGTILYSIEGQEQPPNCSECNNTRIVLATFKDKSIKTTCPACKNKKPTLIVVPRKFTISEVRIYIDEKNQQEIEYIVRSTKHDGHDVDEESLLEYIRNKEEYFLTIEDAEKWCNDYNIKNKKGKK